MELVPEPKLCVCERKGLSPNFHQSRVGLKEVKVRQQYWCEMRLGLDVFIILTVSEIQNSLWPREGVRQQASHPELQKLQEESDGFKTPK